MTPIDDLQRLSAGCHMTLYGVARDDLARLIEAGSAGSSRVTVAFLDDMPARAGPDAALQSVATALWRIARDALTDGLDTGWRPAENAAAPLKRWWRQFTLEPSRRPTRSLPTADELRCYAAIIAQGVLVLAAELSPLRPVYAAVVINMFEWCCREAGTACLYVLEERPPDSAPFDRIAHGAVTTFSAVLTDAVTTSPAVATLVPQRGRPHGGSSIEAKIGALLARDNELAGVFIANPTLALRNGLFQARPDLLWEEGMLAVEFDGFTDHGRREAFRSDRHRDFELLAAGYVVLRITNEEIVEDAQIALEKIRLVVRMRRSEARSAS